MRTCACPCKQNSVQWTQASKRVSRDPWTHDFKRTRGLRVLHCLLDCLRPLHRTAPAAQGALRPLHRIESVALPAGLLAPAAQTLQALHLL